MNYEKINDEYCWGEYGGIKVLIRTKDGYINLPKMCQESGVGKRFDQWLDNAKSKNLVKAFQDDPRYQGIKILETRRGGINLEIRGTYGHPDIVPHIASWISPKFAVFMSRIIYEWRQLSEHNEKLFWSNLSDAIKDGTKQNSKEKELQLEIAQAENGEIEVQTVYGRIDILTPDKVIEVKTAINWKSAIGQVLVYSLCYPSREKWIYLFDHDDVDTYNIQKACKQTGVRVKFI